MEEDRSRPAPNPPANPEFESAPLDAAEVSSGMAPDTLIFRILVGLVLVAAVGYFGGRTVWRAVKVSRAQKQAALADKYLAENNAVEAQRAIRTAILMAPNDAKVLRSTAAWCSLNGRPEGFMYWDRLAQSSPLTHEDQLKKLDLALILHRLDISRDLLKDLLKAGEKDREVLVRAIQHHVQTGRAENAIRAARIAVANAPSDPQLQFMLAGLLVDSTNRTAQAEAHRLLWNVALDNTKWRDPAVDLLVSSRQLSDGDRLLLIRTIEGRDSPSLLDRLRVLELRRGINPDLEKIGEQAQALTAQYPGLTNQIYIARWLAEVGATNRALALLPRDATRTNAAAATSTLEILIRVGDWDGLNLLLDQTPVAIRPSIADAARAVLAARKGRHDEAAGYLSSARQKAAGQVQELIQIASYAERAGQRVAAAENFIAAADANPLLTVQLCRRALAAVQPIEDLSMARRILDQLANFIPGEPSVLLERSWLDLLFEENLDRARQSLNEIKEHPKIGLDARVILAFAELKRGDAGAALAGLEALGVDSSTLSPRLQAAYTAVLLASGQREPARRLALQIPVRSLKKLELDLIAPLL